MITKNWNLTVDFDRGVAYRPMRFVAGDSGSCAITFTTVQDITDLRVFVTFVTADGTPYIEEATVSDANTATLVLPSGVLSVAGQVTCQVAVHDATGRLTNAVGFYYTVSEDLAEGAIEASDQYPILTQLIAECEGIEDAEALRVIAEGAADPRSGRVGAELDREDAEAIRIANEGDETSGRVKAELDRAAAELLRAAAEGAASPRSGRVGAELDRVDAELARVAAEGDATKGRVKAENDRVAAEEAREIAEGLRQAHITDKENPHEVTAAQAGAVATTDIADNLTTDDATKVLSAKQGKVLADLVSTNSALLKFTATNLLANSNFATASGGVATGWVNGSAVGGVSVADNVQYFTGAGALGTSSNNHLSQPSKINKLNHYYYLRVSAKRVSGSAALQFYLGTTYRTLVADVLEDDFKEYSVVFKQTSSTNIDFTLGADSGLAVGVQYAYACDLTETFGEQYIPDKPEIQSLMSLHENNWFDGEKQLAGLKDVYNVGAKNNRKDRVKIYGVRFTGSNPVGERTHDAVGMVAEVGVDNQLVRNDFDSVDFYTRKRCNVYHDAQGRPIVMAYEGEPGFSLTGAVFPPYADPASVFYECKPCYWNGSFDHPQVTATPMEGFELFECFQDRETPMYLPSYWLSVVGGKAASVSGTLPSIGSLNSHMTSARTYHANAHTETMAVHMYEYVLQLVEFSTKDLQTIMMGASNNKYNGSTDTIATVVSDTVFTTTATVGAAFVAGQTISIGSTQNGSDRTGGVVITSIATADGISTFTLESAVATMAPGDFVSTRAWRNGATDIVAASSGSPVSNTSGLYPCIWRGKVDPWASAYSCICDILIQRTGEGTPESAYVYTPHYLTDPTKYNAGTLTADYTKLRFAIPGADGYGKRLGVDSRYRLIGLTDAVGASSTTYLADYYYYPRYEMCVVFVGGYWDIGRSCGPVCFSCSGTPGDSAVHRLARLFITVKTGV